MADNAKIDVFEKYLKNAIFLPLASVTYLQICFWGQEIHFCGYFSLLIKITRFGGQNTPFWGQIMQNLDFLED